jgi:predicted ATPase
LFVERVRAAAPSFSPDGRVVAAIAGICRRLDGIPLAIELAAARAAALGIEGVAARLDNRFRLLAGGHRTAMPRHQTLRATLDWSYELLTEPERVVLRRLAIFAGGFTMQAASAVAADDEIAASEVVDCVANLVAKSLVTAESDGARVRYRLLETTRAYALEKLVQLASLTRWRDATPNATWTCLKAPRRRRRRGQPMNGWQITSREWTICAPRWTGPFPRAVTPRSAWR